MHICLFDIDGTLLNTGGAGQKAMEAALRSRFGDLKPVTGITTAGRTDRAIVTDLFAYYEIAGDEGTWQEFLETYLHHLPQHLADSVGAVLPGIEELLGLLSRRDDVLLGLLTGNFREGARLKLEHYRLHQHFICGGYGDLHLSRDDVAREALEQVTTHLGRDVDVERVWVVGDTPSDVRCARAIGANSVAVATGLYTFEELAAAGPDHLVRDFSDPQHLLSLLT